MFFVTIGIRRQYYIHSAYLKRFPISSTVSGHDVVVRRRNGCLRRVTVLVSSSRLFLDDLPAITGCPFLRSRYLASTKPVWWNLFHHTGCINPFYWYLFMRCFNAFTSQYWQRFERVFGNASSLALLYQIVHYLNVVNPHFSDSEYFKSMVLV